MSKGYVYIMTSAVDGIIKIGNSDNWTRRCQNQLEDNGYKNMNGLKTYFVVECDDYLEIESIMHDIFRESRVIGSNDRKTELFAVDKDRAKRVLSRMGKQVYPNTNITNKVTSINSNSSASTYTNTEQLYLSIWSRMNDLISKRSDIKFNSSKLISNYRSCYNITIPIKGFWLHAWFSKPSNQFNIDFGTSNATDHESLLKYNKILSNKLSFNVSYEKKHNYERVIHYENNVDCNTLSDTDLNHFIDMIVEFYDTILTL